MRKGYAIFWGCKVQDVECKGGQQNCSLEL